ncbi:23S rRNA (adenine(2503)-C(2))-methyltransferase RlmN [soil metagenome]
MMPVDQSVPGPGAVPITALVPGELVALLKAHGQPAYRADQVLDWVYEKRATRYGEMTNLPAGLRAALESAAPFPVVEQVRVQGSHDTTRKFLFRLRDSRLVETVLIPANPAIYGEGSDRLTLCVSSQVGCAYACTFCASGLGGFTRNLDAAEIVGQILAAEREAGERISNIVFMGMGEPLANLANLTRALTILNAPWGVGIGARKITVSTSGLAPQIRKLALLPLQIRLAISLHGATDAVRDQIMPINKKYPLDVLFLALDEWRAHKKQRLTFEYILIQGVNDAPADAVNLARRARAQSAKVNLIPYNTVEGLPWERPPVPRQEAFLKILENAGVPATLRREKGHDI